MGLISGIAALTKSAIASFPLPFPKKPSVTITPPSPAAASSTPPPPTSPSSTLYHKHNVNAAKQLSPDYIEEAFQSSKYKTLTQTVNTAKLNITIRVRKPHCVVVSEVTASSQLRRGDIITDINGKKPGKWLFNVTTQLQEESRPLTLTIFRFNTVNKVVEETLEPLPAAMVLNLSPKGAKMKEGKGGMSPLTSLLVLQVRY